MKKKAVRKYRLFAPKCFRCGVQHPRPKGTIGSGSKLCPKMEVRPADLSLRIAWAIVMVEFGMSERRAARVTGVAAGTIRYRKQRMAKNPRCAGPAIGARMVP